jgi:uncharacterized membrane protein
MTKILARPAWLLMTLLSVGVAAYAYRYLPRSQPLPGNIGANPFADPFLYLHVAGAGTALLVGPFQFLGRLRERFPHAHRVMGRVYGLGCLVGGLAGGLLALGSTAGPIAAIGFGLLAVAWLWTTARAVQLAMARRIAEHHAWMIRSFALTLAAVTLRLYLPAAIVMDLPILEAYRAIAFLCWVPNLLIAELWLRTRTTSALAAAIR